VSYFEFAVPFSICTALGVTMAYMPPPDGVKYILGKVKMEMPAAWSKAVTHDRQVTAMTGLSAEWA
jgi:hypothetical protein